MAATPQNRLRVMADANVLVAASAWPRWPYEVLQHALKDDYQLVLSVEIVHEARSSVAKLGPESLEHLEEMLLGPYARSEKPMP